MTASVNLIPNNPATQQTFDWLHSPPALASSSQTSWRTGCYPLWPPVAISVQSFHAICTRLCSALYQTCYSYPWSTYKSLTVCWLDLSNAYGNVHHDLISFSLKQYGAPHQLISLVNNLYSDLSASIYTQSWTTPNIPLNKGVFRRDPLSVVTFNTVMNTYIKAVDKWVLKC